MNTNIKLKSQGKIRLNSLALKLYFYFIVLFYICYFNYCYNIETEIFNVLIFNYVKIIMISISFLLLFININSTIKLPKIIKYSLYWGLFSLFAIFINNRSSVSELVFNIMDVILWIGVLITTYYFAVNEHKSNYICYIMLITTAYLSIRYFNNKHSGMIHTFSSVNSVYYILLALPILLMMKNNLLKNSSIILVTISAMISQKRTALIALAVSLIIYFAMSSFIERKKNSRKIYNVILLLITVIVIIYFYSYIANQLNFDFVDRFESLTVDGGSGRNVIYRTVIDMQFDSNIFEWFIGHGYNAVLINTPFSLSAHNDFLELLYDYGIIALILYFRIIFALVSYNIKLIKNKSDNSAPFTVSLVIFIIMSMWSHLVIYPTFFIILVFFWGMQIANIEVLDKIDKKEGNYATNKYNNTCI